MMADITMCPGTGCPLREQCYRYMAEPNELRQSWCDFTSQWHRNNDQLDAECPHFIQYLKEKP
jgi:hypothetical protein